MKTAPRVLISGYYGFGNAGDEALLAGLLVGLREVRPEAEVTVLSGHPQATTNEHGVPAVPRDFRTIRRMLGLTDLLISGGGGLLQDSTSWRSPLYYLGVLELARRARVPVAFIGQSIGPLHRSWIRALARRALTRVDALAVRDARSQDALAQLGVGRTGEITADLAFLLQKPSPEEIAAVKQRVGIENGQPLIGVALRPRPGRNGDEELARKVGRILSWQTQALGAQVLLLPMQPSQDLTFAQAASEGMSQALIAPALPARELLALICGCELLVAMRLHALIFAAIGAVPLVGISYDPKVDGLLDQLGLSPAASADNFDGESLEAAITNAWQERRAFNERLAKHTSAMRIAARRNIELAAAILPMVD